LPQINSHRLDPNETLFLDGKINMASEQNKLLMNRGKSHEYSAPTIIKKIKPSLVDQKIQFVADSPRSPF
jgi:hypothetical protein